ncbi:hypothetical protein EFK50_07900 [Nocardioides marmoriginsengisoli]|uniref:Uncharacterized protein n=2 Tax=Nocardioides marmoriginsengisoli TaxID=661483 RepID=A0A3N0CJM0_9ACTN|nr:hypothetical protein EFK50_07900 [Nocardioides marmoriginsengisoli]
MTPPAAPTVETQLAVMDTKLDLILANDRDHETRIRRLERWIWLATGAAAAGGGVGGGLLAKVMGG